MSEITIEYSSIISWTTNGFDGVSFKKNGADEELATAVAEVSGTSAIQTYTYADFVPAIVVSDVITVHYSSLDNTLTDSSGKRLKDLNDISVNCLDGPPVPPFEGGIAISFNGFLLYPNSGFSLQQNPMYMAGS